MRVSKESKNFVKVSISGPKSIIPRTVSINVKETQTWLQVLERNLKLKIAKTTGFFMCTAKYCASNPIPGRGWKSGLTDTVSSFLAKFERNRQEYAVRICNPYDIMVSGKRELTKRKKLSKDTVITSPSPKRVRQRTTTAKEARSSGTNKSPPFSDNLSDSENLDTNLGGENLPTGQDGQNSRRYKGQAGFCRKKNLRSTCLKGVSKTPDLACSKTKREIELRKERKLWKKISAWVARCKNKYPKRRYPEDQRIIQIPLPFGYHGSRPNPLDDTLLTSDNHDRAKSLMVE